MVIVESYGIAVLMCFITMLCWGSWANTQKLATREWRFQLFYWDYAIGVFLLALVLALTLGSTGSAGRNFFQDISQMSGRAFLFALVGGVVFNLANIMLVAAIDIAGMSVAFPIGIGIALVEGVAINYIAKPSGNPLLLFAGVAAVVLAIVIDAVAYGRLKAGEKRTTGKGILISVICGLLMGLFYYLVQTGMVRDFKTPEAGLLEPYAAVVVFSIGLLLSTFVWNSNLLSKILTGEKVVFKEYFTKGTPKLHGVGILGGVIWSIGMSFSIIASGSAGASISYGLGQGATMVAAFWGVFIWKEFKNAEKATDALLALMFVFYLIGLALIIIARLV